MLSRLLFLALLLVAVPAFASDGVLEINQTCAVETGCFPGDAPGLPVTITGSAGRSYKLTSDLRMSADDSAAISITADNISLDLAGFMISCTVFVPPSFVEPCSTLGSASQDAVLIPFDRRGAEVRNGVIFGMRGNGIKGGRHSIASGLRVYGNAGFGITMAGASIATTNVCFDNLVGIAISGNGGGLAVNNTLFDNSIGLNVNGAYRGNVITDSSGTPAFGANAGGNYCAGPTVTSPSCP